MRRRLAVTLLRVLLAAGLIGYVVYTIDFRDVLIIHNAKGEQRIRGRIVNEERESVTFEGEGRLFKAVPRYVEGSRQPLAAREGIVTLFRGMSLPWFGMALGMYFILIVLTVVRWRMLLHSQAIDIPF